MDDKITTQWKGDLIFESLNPNESTLISRIWAKQG